MSQENVEVVRRSFDVLAREGPEAVLGFFDPGIEWTTTDGYIDAATYRGHDGVLRYYRALAGEFDGFRIEPLEFIDAGDQVVVSVRTSGRGKVSGAPVELRMTAVSSLRDGKITRIRNYQDRDAALEAVGLRKPPLPEQNA